MDMNFHTLTAAINLVPHLPTHLGDLGLFEYDGVTTTSVEIEREGMTLSLVGSRPRGAKGQAIGRATRDLRPFRLVHLPQADQLLADEVQDVRGFGTSNGPEPLQRRLNQILAMGSQNNDLTMEFHRVGALKGIVYDSNGTSVLYNFFTEFGVSQQTLSFALGTAGTSIRSKVDEAQDLSADELGGMAPSGFAALCGPVFWRGLIEHPKVRETYLNQAASSELRRQTDRFVQGETEFVKYKGKIGGANPIGDNDAYLVPRGVPGLLLGRFGPANRAETVNTTGLPMYASAELMKHGKGWDIEMQSNVLHACTRPRAIVKLTVA